MPTHLVYLPLVFVCACSMAAPTPTPTPTPRATATNLPTSTFTSTPVAPTSTVTPTAQPTLTFTPTPSPTTTSFTWPTDSPAQHGFDETKLAAIANTVTRTLPFVDGVLIIRNGYLVYENYFNNYDATKLHDLASVTKSFASALVGVAQAQGKLMNLDAKLPELLPVYFAEDKHTDKKDITLRHLLTMRSGLEWSEQASNDGLLGDPATLLSQDLTEAILSLSVAHPPGEIWNYSTADVQLVSAIMQQATGVSMKAFAAAHLFAPLNIRGFEWVQTTNGTTIGGTLLRLAPRDMAKLGQLYLQRGRWAGQPVVPADWVSLTTTSQSSNVDWYGYLWWLRGRGYYDVRSNAIVAYGYGGQFIVALPELDLIVVTTATYEVNSGQAGAQEQAVYEFIRDVILPTLNSA